MVHVHVILMFYNTVVPLLVATETTSDIPKNWPHYNTVL